MSLSEVQRSSDELPVLTPCRRFALVGSPNSGKTTLFNALTGLRRKVANYAGVTVECAYGLVGDPDGRQAEMIDLPGTYSLEPLSPEERITLDHLRGEIPCAPPPDAIVFVADSTTLARSLPLLGAAIRFGLPVLLVLTMIDEIQARQGAIDLPKLEALLGMPVLTVVGNRKRGIGEVRQRLLGAEWSVPVPIRPVPERPEDRFAWADGILNEAYRSPAQGTPWTDRIDHWLLHPLSGTLTFAAVMVFFFQAIFSWAEPMMDGLESGVSWVGGQLAAWVPSGLLQEVLIDGVLTGVGSVVVFVPQIALLFLLLTFFEQVGYMSRAVFLIDRVMSWIGLDGRCFVALLSSYACAIPGIMATRSVPDRRQRLATILVAPFMTCSARLPVYALLIAAFVPASTVWGYLNLQGLVMLGLYLLGALAALTAASLLRRGPLKGGSMPFYVELPPYRWPTWKALARGVWSPVSRFVRRAGTVILAASLVVWTLTTFPAAPGTEPGQTERLEGSLAASIGQAAAPLFEPIGFDWRITVGLGSSLVAREVIVATMAQIYSAKGDEALQGALQKGLAPPGVADPTPNQRLAVALSLLVFFVFALQCTSTLVVMRRETGSWRIPAAAFAGMFLIAYLASFATYRATLWLG